MCQSNQSQGRHRPIQARELNRTDRRRPIARTLSSFACHWQAHALMLRTGLDIVQKKLLTLARYN